MLSVCVTTMSEGVKVSLGIVTTSFLDTVQIGEHFHILSGLCASLKKKRWRLGEGAECRLLQNRLPGPDVKSTLMCFMAQFGGSVASNYP